MKTHLISNLYQQHSDTSYDNDYVDQYIYLKADQIKGYIGIC